MNEMKNKVYSIILLAVLATALQGCQKWEEYNTNPYGVTNEMLAVSHGYDRFVRKTDFALFILDWLRVIEVYLSESLIIEE